MSEIWPGDVLKGASGQEWVIGFPIGMAPDPDVPCDAEFPSVYPDGRCRCTVCPRCKHHTGNSHQGHYWASCKVTKTLREHHLCCDDPEFGCELETPS